MYTNIDICIVVKNLLMTILSSYLLSDHQKHKKNLVHFSCYILLDEIKQKISFFNDIPFFKKIFIFLIFNEQVVVLTI